MSIKDSGTRRNFDSGAVRDAETGKGRFDLIPPVALTRLAQHYEGGAVKYDARNWEKGIPLGTYLDSCLRHINKYREGIRDEDHMAAALWNIAGFIHTEEMINRGILPKELDDLPTYVVKPGPATASEAIKLRPNDDLPSYIKSPLKQALDDLPNYVSTSLQKAVKLHDKQVLFPWIRVYFNNVSGEIKKEEILFNEIYKPPKKYTAYFSHHIRGVKGDAATDEDMLENRKDAIEVCNIIRKLLPDWEIYCPAEVDEVISELLKSKVIGEKEILDADCKILEKRDALIAYTKDGHISRGMQIELDHAQKIKTPSIMFSVLHDADLLAFINDVVEYGDKE